MCAWTSMGASNNEEFIEQLKEYGVIKSQEVYDVMLTIDRKNFTEDPYNDCPQSIPNSEVTISAPHMHSYCLELLKEQLKPGANVLDIGFGSGIFTALMAEMVGEEGKVTGIDIIPYLLEYGRENIMKENSYLIENDRIEIVLQDGWKGFVDNSPYDAIHVGAAVEFLPQDLVDQLAINGRLIIPVGKNTQYLMQYDKISEDEIKGTKVLGVNYVPLVKTE
eukprot:TRINITY_DN13_c5_g1_i1.p1 TRINITY_DN13_c5_g1~~TRINITY_DN13_c5_g1_i1.p1  ORF type:complete len:221 (-),score=72.66 TRINITY_DN13_c5_g1_i1:203-865(-)